MNTKLAYSVSAAAEAADSGRTKLYEAIKRGDLVARKHGTRTIILAEDLQAWLAALPKLETGRSRHGLPTAPPSGRRRRERAAG